MGRRMGWGAVAVAGVLAATTACSGGGATAPAPGGFDMSKLKQTTTAGSGDAGTILWSMPLEPLSLDPLKSYDYPQSTALGNLCESLIRLEPDFSMSPGLAESWEQVDDKTLVFTIREGVTFWDGEPLTAEDVAFSLNRHLDPDQGTWWGKYFRFVDSVEATGADQVTVKFSQPDALFLPAMSSGPGIITEKAFTEKAGADFGNPSTGVMCTGPFRFESWSSGDAIETVRYDGYWDTERMPVSAALKYVFIPDEKTASNALLSGEVDGGYWPQPPAFVKQLDQAEGGELAFGESMTTWDVLSAAKEGPYADPRLRNALSLALDRDALVKAVFFGAGTPARTLYSPEQVTYANETFQKAYDELGEPKQDVEAAKKLVDEVGAPDTAMVIAYAAENGVHERTATILKATAESLGLKAELRAMPGAQYGNIYTDEKTREGIDFFLGTYYGVQDPLDMFTMFEKGDIENFANYTEADQEIREARAELDPERRAQMVVEIQKKIMGDMVWIPLVTLPTTLYQGKRVTGATASFAYMYSPWATAIGTR